jgi:hypothetical protein
VDHFFAAIAALSMVASCSDIVVKLALSNLFITINAITGNAVWLVPFYQINGLPLLFAVDLCDLGDLSLAQWTRILRLDPLVYADEAESVLARVQLCFGGFGHLLEADRARFKSLYLWHLG